MRSSDLLPSGLLMLIDLPVELVRHIIVISACPAASSASGFGKGFDSSRSLASSGLIEST